MAKLRVLVNVGDGSVLVWTEIIALDPAFREGWIENGAVTMTDGGPVPGPKQPDPQPKPDPHVVAEDFPTVLIPPVPAQPAPPVSLTPELLATMGLKALRQYARAELQMPLPVGKSLAEQRETVWQAWKSKMGV